MLSNRLTELTKSLSLAEKNDKPMETEKVDPSTEKFLNEFYKTTQSLDVTMNDVLDLVGKLKEVHVKVLKATMTNEKKELKKQMETLVGGITSKNRTIRSELEKIGKETDKRKEELGGKITSEIRIREGNHSSLCIKFKNLVGTFSGVQEEFKKKASDAAFKQYKISHPHKKDEEIRAIIEQQETQEEKKNTLSKSQQGTLDAYYDEAVETRRDVLLIQQSLIELQELFMTMEKLVDMQDDLLDNIEANIERSVDSINEGNEMMKDAAGLSITNTPFTIINKLRGVK